MEISEKLLCLFSAEVREEGDEYVVDVPRREVDTGSLEPGETYRVALISRAGSGEPDAGGAESETDISASSADDGPQPPVEPGEMRYVEIEDLGKQGDGIARVERGYVIIVPGHGGRRAGQSRGDGGQVELRGRRGRGGVMSDSIGARRRPPSSQSASSSGTRASQYETDAA